jgi:N-acetylmuramoyl-L-alanine amidase
MAITLDTAYRTIGGTTRTAFLAELSGTPIEPESDGLYEIVRPHARLYLGHSKIENDHDRIGILIDRSMHNNLCLRPRGYPEEQGQKNGFAIFASYADCARAWLRRLTDTTIDTGRQPKNYVEATTLLSYATVYNPPDDEHPITHEQNKPRIYARKLATVANGLPPLEENPVGNRQTILVVAGHRSTNGAGDQAEKDRTPGLARAYRDALREAGHQVFWLQEIDGDADPDDTVGGLDTVGRLTRERCTQLGATVMLDLHFEGHPSPAVRGAFAVVPDATGLVTAVPGGAPSDDTIANNTRDVRLARAVTRRLMEATGLPTRPLNPPGEPGVMSERQTFVGQGGGGAHPPSRLAMFAHTAALRHSTVRLVIEHGALTNPQDREIIDSPGFPARAGAAIVRAVADVFDDD